MEKITFAPDDSQEPVEFYVLEQTRVNGTDYILVTDSEKGDADAMILKDVSSPEDREAVYVAVTEEAELEAVAGIFEEILEDVSFE